MGGVKEIAELAQSGDANAKAVFEDFGQKLGTFLRPWIKEFEANCLIIGGNISRSASLFLPSFYKEMDQDQLQLTVIMSQLLDKAGILGAARLFSSD